ncbi:hypothetical protein [Clostridium ganghwense]|uniref:Lipoprotein n=1 Tax=Clostridium ganghwense TaxID=312089 RepID=A0ABT4CR00_9CLOT|nr:hypothetical protein [Clostridium ganghwense]MCY6371492.1 hypothetical protein [Clostridium ganghwense]
MQKVILGLIIGIFSLTGFSSQTSTTKINNSNVSSEVLNESKSESKYSAKDFVPKKPMIKVFNGDFENGGRVEVVDKVTQDKYQIKVLNTGTGGVGVYEIKENEIRAVYGIGETEIFEESYLNKEPNSNELILKGPIKKGTKWSYNENEFCEITGIDVEVKTPAGNYNTIEITYKNGDYESKQYYAKGIGLVKIATEMYPSELIEVDYDMEQIKNLESLFDLLKKCRK